FLILAVRLHRYLYYFPTRRCSDLLFQDKGILPGKRLLIIYSLLSVALLLLAFTDISWIYLISVNVLFILASFFDLLFLPKRRDRSEEHTSELQSRFDLVCRLLLEK